MTNFKCRNCGKLAKFSKSLSEIWDIYLKAKLCPDCYDRGAAGEMRRKVLGVFLPKGF